MPYSSIILDAQTDQSFLDMERADPFTKEPLKPGDEVVVCGKCLSVYLVDSWEFIKHQHKCGQGNLVAFLPTGGLEPNILLFETSSRLFTGAEPITLKWEVVQNPRKVLLNGEAVNAKGTKQVLPSVPTDFELIAVNSFGKSQQSILIDCDIQLPEVSLFTISRDFLNDKKPVILSWKVHHAESIYIHPDVGAVQPSGTIELWPRKDTEYHIKAFNLANDLAEETVSVIVDKTPPKITSFTSSTKLLEKEEPIQLSWQIENAETVHITPGIGWVKPQGKQEASINRDTRFTLTATSYFGESAEQHLEVHTTKSAPEIQYFFTLPGVVFNGNTSKLVWKAVDEGTSCSAVIQPSPGAVQASGSSNVQPAISSDFELMAKNYFGNTSTATTHIRVLPFPEKRLGAASTIDAKTKFSRRTTNFHTSSKVNAKSSVKASSKLYTTTEPIYKSVTPKYSTP